MTKSEELAALKLNRFMRKNDAESDRLRALLRRLYNWASTSNDWREDSKLARDVHQALDR